MAKWFARAWKFGAARRFKFGALAMLGHGFRASFPATETVLFSIRSIARSQPIPWCSISFRKRRREGRNPRHLPALTRGCTIIRTWNPSIIGETVESKKEFAKVVQHYEKEDETLLRNCLLLPSRNDEGELEGVFVSAEK